MKRYRRAIVLSLLVVVLTIPLAIGAPQRVPVPNDTLFLIRLKETISSKHSKVGERFTATVVSPKAYRGAVIIGEVSYINKSDRVEGKVELGLSFYRIQLRDGRVARFNTELLEVRQSEKVRVVDEEGYIHSGSRGRQAIKRASLGAAGGGVLGGLIGGRKGVAIGLIIGAGVSAGSLIVDGSKELKLERGTQMLIRTIRSDAASNVLDP
jgi:hypothetical protein